MTSYTFAPLSTSLGVGSYVTSNFLNQSGGEASNNDASMRLQKPRILLMGLRRSGKSSIIKVVFHKMAPNETLYLDSTNRVEKDDISSHSFVQFQVWEFPGQLDISDPNIDVDSLFMGCNALIYIIDSQDEYFESLIKLRRTVARAFPLNPRCHFEIFIHKVDGLADDDRSQIQTSIMHRVIEDLSADNIRAENGLNLSFHLTSIYDHSIFEAFSRVVQKLIPNLGTLEMLLDIFNRNSNIYKSFLFDMTSKIYIATDSTPVDMQSYEICCDMIDVVLDMSWIYGSQKHGFYDQLPFDSSSRAVVRLNNHILLYLREVNTYLGLVALMREDAFAKQGIIDYNFSCLKKGVIELFSVSASAQQQQTNGGVTNNADSPTSSAVVGRSTSGQSGTAVTPTEVQFQPASNQQQRPGQPRQGQRV